MNTLAQLKKNRQSNLSDLTKKIEEMNSSPQQQQSNNNDDNLWKPSVGKDGNGYAVIRFLPPPKGEEMPFVRIWDHGFQGPGGWYIEKSLTTLGEKDPVSELNTQLWNTGREEDKNTARLTTNQKASQKECETQLQTWHWVEARFSQPHRMMGESRTRGHQGPHDHSSLQPTSGHNEEEGDVNEKFLPSVNNYLNQLSLI